MSRSPFIDFLKGVLIYLVVTGHVLQHGVHQWVGFWEDPAMKAIYMFHMPLFMAIAGYLSQAGLGRVSAWQAIRSRAAAYLVPAIAWSVAYCLAVTVLIDRLAPGTLEHLPAYLLKQISSDLWFLWALFGSVAVTVLAQLSGRFFRLVYPLTFLAVLMLPEQGNLIFFKYTYPFFQIGYALSRWGIPGVFLKHRRATFALFAALSVACFLAFHTETYVYTSGMALTAENAPNLLLRYASAICSSVAVTYALRLIFFRLPGKVSEVFQAFGRDSIYIYIIQNYFFMVVDRVCERVHVPKPGLIAGWFIALAAALLISAGCYLAGVLLSKGPLIARIAFGKTGKKLSAPSAKAASPSLAATAE